MKLFLIVYIDMLDASLVSVDFLGMGGDAKRRWFANMFFGNRHVISLNPPITGLWTTSNILWGEWFSWKISRTWSMTYEIIAHVVKKKKKILMKNENSLLKNTSLFHKSIFFHRNFTFCYQFSLEEKWSCWWHGYILETQILGIVLNAPPPYL